MAATPIISIVQVSEQILVACFQYCKTAKDAVKDIQAVINAISGFKSTLETLKAFDDPALQSLEYLKKDAFDQCDEELRKIAKVLGYESIEKMTDSTKEKLGFMRRAKWPLKKNEVDKLVQFIETHKTNFILAISTDTVQVDLEIKEIVVETATMIQKMILSKEDEKVLSWLRVVNTSTNHKVARDKREPTTGDWFIRSESFVNWTTSQTASLWLHGIPGAGKTVLCSTIIEHVKGLCIPNSLDQYAYFYFNFNDRPNAGSMLSCIIADLCDRKRLVSPQLHQLYRQCDNGQVAPKLPDLIQFFTSPLASTHRTFILLDALDECPSGPDRDNLLEVLTVMISMGNLNILLTSRREKDIAEELEGLANLVIIDLKSGGLDSDIELYVQNRLVQDRKLQRWDPDPKQKIQKALVDGANGM